MSQGGGGGWVVGGIQGFDLLHVSSRRMNPMDPGPRQIMQSLTPSCPGVRRFWASRKPRHCCKGGKLDSMNHDGFVSAFEVE